MSARKLSYAFVTLSLAFVLWPTSPATFPAAQVHQAQSQMSKIATRTAAGRIKLDVRPDAASVLISSNVSLKVFIRNADNQPPTWNNPYTVNLEITFPFKKVKKHTVVLPAGKYSAVWS